MFANDDNEKTIKTYASLLRDIREGKTIGVDIDHTGGPDDNAKITLLLRKAKWMTALTPPIHMMLLDQKKILKSI